MARQRNNIYAVAADAVDLALDTAGTIGSMVGGMAHMIGIGSSEPEKSEEESRKEADDAADRIATSLRQEADAAAPAIHRVKSAKKRLARTGTAKRAKSVKSIKKSAKRRAA